MYKSAFKSIIFIFVFINSTAQAQTSDIIFTIKGQYYGNTLSAGSEKAEGLNNAYGMSLGLFFTRIGFFLSGIQFSDATIDAGDNEKILKSSQANLGLNFRTIKENTLLFYIGLRTVRIDISQGSEEEYQEENIKKEMAILGISTSLKIGQSGMSWYISGDYGIDIGGKNEDSEQTDFNRYADDVTTMNGFNAETGFQYMFPSKHVGIVFGGRYQNFTMSTSASAFPYSYKTFENLGAFVGIGLTF